MQVEELKIYKDSLYSSLSRDLDAFEKNFIFITTGILAFSVTFIKDIVKIEEASLLLFLFIGWLLIIVSVALMMFTFLSSVTGSNMLWKLVDTFLVSNMKFDPSANLTDAEALAIKTSINNSYYKIKKKLQRLRAASVWSFILGFSFVVFFVGINMYHENNKGQLDSCTEDSKEKINTSSLKK